MSATKEMSIRLPEEMVKMVRAKVASGEYADEGDVVCDGLLELRHATRVSKNSCAMRWSLLTMRFDCCGDSIETHLQIRCCFVFTGGSTEVHGSYCNILRVARDAP